MIESNLAVKIHRVRETASHSSFRGEEDNGGLKGLKGVAKVQEPYGLWEQQVCLTVATSEHLIFFGLPIIFSKKRFPSTPES
jgi:hypothetical protein